MSDELRKALRELDQAWEEFRKKLDGHDHVSYAEKEREFYGYIQLKAMVLDCLVRENEHVALSHIHSKMGVWKIKGSTLAVR